MLCVEQLTKSFGSNQAVQGISFSVAKGEAYGLLGPNGAGKSTTISMVMGLLKPDAGEISVGGLTLNKHPQEVKQKLGYVPQEIALYGELSARENLVYWGKLYGLHGKTLAARIDSALDIVGLAQREKGRVSTFSGGMKRRINIAAALLHNPEIIIMDEPTVGIDPQSRNH
ncbi:MAG TPA: ABC transporter ATP-binding protein, partial [Verrucomicrobiae bacterium]|nr:ABC transporter ATP-binding protein [Verrucomicrobiae bacterium]